MVMTLDGDDLGNDLKDEWSEQEFLFALDSLIYEKTIKDLGSDYMILTTRVRANLHIACTVRGMG